MQLTAEHISFDPAKHTYTNTLTGDRLESVTTYIKRHTNPFDADFHAGNYAVKHNLEKQAVLDMWAEKGRQAAIDGTRAHQILETYAKSKRVEIVEPCKHIEGIRAFIRDKYESGEYTPIESEIMLTDGELAGIADVIVKDRAGNYILLDYKTNEKINTFSYGKYMLAPYEYLPDANYYHYSLQLNIYKNMTFYPIKECHIVHILPKIYKIIKAQNIF